MVAFACALVLMSPDLFKQRGLETLEVIRQHYYMPEERLYADAYEVGKPHTQVAFNWGVGVQIPAMCAAADLDQAWKPRLREYVDRAYSYWNNTGPVAGFDVLPGLGRPDRYYDDNAWMVMALVEASETLKDPKLLGHAKDALKFVLSGEDEKLGGGIYWQENKKESKNTCSNAPAAAACLAVYRKTKDPELLRKAREIYAWTKKNLQDPKDFLYYDAIGLDGKIHDMKWTYNTALMIRSAAELYDLTKTKSYAEDAQMMAKSSVSHWVDPETGAIKDPGRFSHLLIESWQFQMRYAPTSESGAPTPEIIDRAFNFLWDHARRKDGLFGDRWEKPANENRQKFELLDEACVARGFLFVARERMARR